MKNNYLFKTLGVVFAVGLLLTGLKTEAQNRNYLDFDGNDQYVIYTNDATLELMDNATDYTIEAWIYPKSADIADYDYIINRIYTFKLEIWKVNVNNGTCDWWFGTSTDGSNYTNFNTQGDVTLTLNAWNHIAVVNNSSDNTLKLFVNGVDVTTTGGYSNQTLSNHTSDNLYIGSKKASTPNNSFGGYIDEVRIKNVAENPANLHYHITDNQYASDANTAGLFHINEGSTTNTLNEASSVNATLNNGPTWSAWSAHSHLPLAYEWTGGGADIDWSTTGNWDSGVAPGSTNDVIVSSVTNQPSIDGDATTPSECNNLLIESGATLTIPTGKALTVDGDFTNEGTVTVESAASSIDGSLIVNGSVTGSCDIKRYIGYTTWDNTHGWHYISSPVVSQAISDFHTAGSGDDFYKWDESSNVWINRTASGGSLNASFETNFKVGQGYLIALATADTKTFSGTINVDDADSTSMSLDNDGWHLLGNPFPSAIWWDSTKASWNLTNINSNAKIWEESAASFTDVPPEAPIPAMQGFMVQVNTASGSLTIPASARTHSATGWYKTDAINQIKLTAHDTENNTAQVSIVKANANATTGFDTEFDAHFLAGYAPQFYSVVGDEHFSTNTLPEITSMETIPFDFIKNGSTNYYIEVEGVNNLVPAEEVYLTDLKTNISQKLNDNPVYYFTAEEGDVAQRFELHFGPLGIDDNSSVIPFNVFSVYNNIKVRTGKPIDAMVKIYNVSGQLIATTNMNHQSEVSLNMNGFTGIAIVSIITNKQAYNQKVIIK